MTGEAPTGSTDELDGILAWLDEKPTIARHASAVRRLDDLHAKDPERFTRRRVVFVRNFTIEPIEALLKVAAYRAGLSVEIAYGGYDPAPDEELDALLDAGTDVVVVALRLEDLAPVLTKGPSANALEIAEDVVARVDALARHIRGRTGAAILLQNFAMPVAAAGGLAGAQDPAGEVNLVRHMNVRLAESLTAIDGAVIVDADHLFARIGLEHCYDERGDRVAGAPLTQDALRALAGAYVRHVRAMSGPAAKCIVVDCDNTLWGGVVGEDGLEGIALGESGDGAKFTALQHDLLELKRRGIVLAISSKNEEADVLEVLRNHPFSVLHEDDFAAMRVNWDDKAQNIEAIASELNLGLEHVVFVDDNEVEIEWVARRLPAVRVLHWAPGSSGLRDLPMFDSLVVTDEDSRRTEMYRSEAKRRAARSDDLSLEDYLRSLEMVATIGYMSAKELPRLVQLTQRTNQFNLTTRRYDAAELQAIADNDASRVLWLDLEDRFGSNGIVGCAIVRRNGDDARIDTLLLSCRVIGRGAETVLVNRLGIIARDMGAKVLVGEYVPTERNAQVADLYTRLGFVPDGARFTWDLAAGDPVASDQIKVIDAWR